MKSGLYKQIADGTWIVVTARHGVVALGNSSAEVSGSARVRELSDTEPGMCEFCLRQPAVIVTKVAKTKLQRLSY